MILKSYCCVSSATTSSRSAAPLVNANSAEVPSVTSSPTRLMNSSSMPSFRHPASPFERARRHRPYTMPSLQGRPMAYSTSLARRWRPYGPHVPKSRPTPCRRAPPRSRAATPPSPLRCWRSAISSSYRASATPMPRPESTSQPHGTIPQITVAPSSRSRAAGILRDFVLRAFT
jgi:hypothetical protein